MNDSHAVRSEKTGRASSFTERCKIMETADRRQGISKFRVRLRRDMKILEDLQVVIRKVRAGSGTADAGPGLSGGGICPGMEVEALVSP